MNVLNKAKFHIKRIRENLKHYSFVFSYSLISKNVDENFANEISFDNFKAQIKYVKERYNIISLDAITEALNSHKLYRNSMALTFDLGYLETIELVVPFLKSMQIPAAFFIRNGDFFQYENILIDDILKMIFLGKISRESQENIENYLKDKKYMWSLNSRVEKIETLHRMLKSIYKSKKSKRAETVNSLIESWSLNLEDKIKYEIASSESLRELVKNDLFTIGINFNFIAGLENKYQSDEILERKRFFESEINNEIKYCSYFLLDPENFWIENGNIFKNLGFKAACFNLPSLIRNNTSIYQIPRFNPRNMDLIQFKRNLNEFLK